MDNNKNDAEPLPLIKVVTKDNFEHKLDLGFHCYEVMPGSPEEKELNKRLKPEVYLAMDQADRYLGTGKDMEASDDSCYAVIPVLEFLKGKPWNNMALNFVQALRPSMLRVTYGEIQCDSRRWRVTVYLESEGSMIKRIEQEVTAGALGVRYGHDLHAYMHGYGPSPCAPTAIINTRALRALKLQSELQELEDSSLEAVMPETEEK